MTKAVTFDESDRSVTQELGVVGVGPVAELLEADGSGQVLTKGVPPSGFSIINYLEKFKFT